MNDGKLISSVPVGQPTCKQCQNSWSQNSTLKTQTIMHDITEHGVNGVDRSVLSLVIKCEPFHKILTCRNWQKCMPKTHYEDAQCVNMVRMGLIDHELCNIIKSPCKHCQKCQISMLKSIRIHMKMVRMGLIVGELCNKVLASTARNVKLVC